MCIACGVADRVPPLARHFHDFLRHPGESLLLAPLLLHQPPLFDILPLYIRMLGATPWLLKAARHWGWNRVKLVSGLGWLAIQCHLQTHVLGDPSNMLPVRFGAFSFLAWQFLWVTGLAIGESWLRRPLIRPEQRTKVGLAASAIVVLGLACRHGLWPSAWFPSDIYLLMDKWTLGPLRLLNLGAWVLLLMAWNPELPAGLLAPLALLGRNSLTVFATHLVLAIAATSAIGMLALSVGQQAVLGLLVIAVLFPCAALYEHAVRTPTRPAQGAGPDPASIHPISHPLADSLAETLESAPSSR